MQEEILKKYQYRVQLFLTEPHCEQLTQAHTRST